MSNNNTLLKLYEDNYFPFKINNWRHLDVIIHLTGAQVSKRREKRIHPKGRLIISKRRVDINQSSAITGSISRARSLDQNDRKQITNLGAKLETDGQPDCFWKRKQIRDRCALCLWIQTAALWRASQTAADWKQSLHAAHSLYALQDACLRTNRHTQIIRLTDE